MDAFLAAVALTLNSGVAVYLCLGEPLAVECIAASTLALVLLLVQHLLRGEPGHDGGSSIKRSVLVLLKAGVLVLTLALVSMIAYRLLQTANPSTRLLYWAVAGVAVLGVGGYSAALLHRRSWSKQPCQELVFFERSQDVVFPLVKHLP